MSGRPARLPPLKGSRTHPLKVTAGVDYVVRRSSVRRSSGAPREAAPRHAALRENHRAELLCSSYRLCTNANLLVRLDAEAGGSGRVRCGDENGWSSPALSVQGFGLRPEIR